MQMPRLSVALAIGLVTACAPAHVVSTPAPTPVAGIDIRYAVRPDTTHLVTARVISLDADRLVFERFIPGDRARWLTDSLAVDSIARLQVRVGRRGNGGRGALIGGAIGAALGIACAADYDAESWFSPTPGQCLLSGTLTGAGIGLLFGALARSDVWAPAPLPTHRPEEPPPPASVSTARIGIGIRIPMRLPIP
jgi:hypothetical protein